MGSAFYLDFAAFHAQGLVQRDWLQVFDGHLSRERNHLVQFVYLAHGVVEDAGDDAAVAVAGWSGVALAQAEAADEGLTGLVEDEFETHAFGIVHATDEAVVFLHFDVAGVVALGLGWHAMILTCGTSLGRWNSAGERGRSVRCGRNPCGG